MDCDGKKGEVDFGNCIINNDLVWVIWGNIVKGIKYFVWILFWEHWGAIGVFF